jgi:hypothetical protein
VLQKSKNSVTASLVPYDIIFKKRINITNVLKIKIGLDNKRSFHRKLVDTTIKADLDDCSILMII